MSGSVRFVLGTAGHIDHGKTSLVRALTGVDTDRWQEEKDRGITIDLGFARLSLNEGPAIAIVDVPGHEAFVRNMLAGASGLDAALLVIAADEGPMPQTLEHLAILELMGVTRAIVALTKMDLVEADWAELVESEVVDLLEGTALEGSPIVPVSASGEPGVGTLLTALESLAGEVVPRAASDVFRMPVDRAFTVRGTGTVVTGTIWSGTAKVGDVLHLMPADQTARIRRIHAFGEEADEAVAGTRAALALAGIEKADAPRGSTVTNVGWWQATTRFTARISTLEGVAPLVPDQRVRIHVGTAEVMARIHPFGPDVGTSMTPVWGEVRLEGPALVRGGDRFVLRSYSPVTTIGGGTVLEPFPPTRRMRSTDPSTLHDALGPVDRRMAHALGVAGHSGMSVDELAVWVGGPVTGADLGDAEAAGRVLRVADRAYSPEVLAQMRDAVLADVDERHTLNPLEPGAPLVAIRRLDSGSGAVVGAALAALESDGLIEVVEGWVARSGFTPTPTPEQAEAVAAVSRVLRSAGLEAPKLADLASLAGMVDAPVELEMIVSFLARRGELIRLPGDGGLIAWALVLEEAGEAVRTTFAGRDGLGPADFREVLDVSRRHLVPILSYLDVVGVTVRRDDGRSVPG